MNPGHLSCGSGRQGVVVVTVRVAAGAAMVWLLSTISNVVLNLV